MPINGFFVASQQLASVMSRYISFFCGRFCHTAQNLKVYLTEREVRPGLDLQGNRLQYYRLNYSFNYYSPSKSDIRRPSLGISSFLTLTWLGYSPKHPKAQHFQKLFHSCFFFFFPFSSYKGRHAREDIWTFFQLCHINYLLTITILWFLFFILLFILYI